jgi:spore germination protein GerM
MRALRVLVLGLALLPACARTSGTVEVPPDELPFSVARDASPPASPAPSRNVTVYFARDGRLFAVSRRVDADASPAEGSLRTLLGGPSSLDRRRAIGSEVPSAVRLLNVTVVGTTARVDLSGEFQEPAPPSQIALRVAQVVWTLSELPEVDDVLFAIDGEMVEITTGAETLVQRGVTRADYLRFSPP